MSSSNADSSNLASAPRRLQLSFLHVGSSSGNFIRRILFLALLFASELIVLSVWLDDGSLARLSTLSSVIQDWGAWVLRCVVGFAAIFITFACLKKEAALRRISQQAAQTSIRWSLLGFHCFAMVIWGVLSSFLYSGNGSAWPNLLATAWFAAGVSAIVFAGLAFLPFTIWVRLVRDTGPLCVYAFAAAVSACVIGNMDRRLWQSASQLSHLTFGLTKIFLSPFVSGIVADPRAMVLGTSRFHVEIAPQCSGIEGIGLILAFSVLWLLVFRRECRFPHSLVLIPLGVALIFVLNVVRIVALILIGNAGARQIALGGFHSQAGWIAFSAVAVGFCLAVERLPWFMAKQRNRESIVATGENPTAAFLLPFLMILAAGMVGGALTGRFEWLYPLRFFVAAWMLWMFRSVYAGLSWKCDWVAPIIGVIVFVVWIGFDRFSNPHATDAGVPVALMNSSTVARAIWMSFRVLAAVLTVPLAEELAFRGFLMRRLISRHFESVSFRRFSWFALLASSIAFGFLHGGYRIAGAIAGILFGLAMIQRGSIGQSVVAHATANALLAIYVLSYHQWHLW